MDEYNNVVALLDREDVEALLHHYLNCISKGEDAGSVNNAVKRAAKCIDWLEELEAQANKPEQQPNFTTEAKAVEVE